MNKNMLLVFGLIVLLIACILGTGCTDNSSAANTTPQTGTVTSTSPRYITGDIVRNPNATYETAWLVLGYNSSADSYQRALIYPNADGSWGYRRNSVTDTITRSVMEKTNTEKVTNKLPSSIPIRLPTVVTTTTTSTATPTNTTSTSTTTTVSPTGKPTFKKIDPDEGTAGTQISITALTGTNFQSGATVMLIKADNPNITATNVDVRSSTLMTCTLTPPSNATAGAWDVVITNPDGQYVVYANIFSLHAPVGTTTTTSSSDSEGITSISPAFTYGNDVPMTISGTNFQQGFTAKMTKSTNTNTVIEARSIRWDSTTQVTAWFTIPEPRQRGTYNVIVKNPDGTTRTLLNGFEVR